jgi:hypothetical protein
MWVSKALKFVRNIHRCVEHLTLNLSGSALSTAVSFSRIHLDIVI